MPVQDNSAAPVLRDDFPESASRAAMVAVLRGYGTLQRLMEPYFAGFDLTPPQFQLLTIANRFGDAPPTQRRLARELYVSFPNVTLLLKRLERKGLVERRGNPADRREKYVQLTASGRRLLKRIWLVHQQQMDLVMKGLTVPERKELAKLLSKMTAAHRRVD
ncbi:MAG: MarR family transcriptional regulator [Planctomycetes bacterium]|nr:MarR family transcriptional regulator [Planctomycetota bacterium]